MIDFFARHPTAGNLLMLFLAILGFTALPGLQRETFPDFASDEIEIRVVYPGASAEDVEEALCQRIEDAVDGISDVAEMRCDAKEGFSVAVVEMEEGGDLLRFKDDIKTEIDAIDNFPEQVEPPVIRELGRTNRVVSIAVTGPMSVSHLKAYAEQVKDRFQVLPEVSQVDVKGFSDHQLRIEVPASALRQYGVSMSDIANVIARQGVDLPAGSLEARERDILLRFTDLRRTPEELADLVVVSASSGSEIRLGDIAHISDRFELDEDKILFNGKRAAILQINKTKQQDTLVVIDAVTLYLDELRLTAPSGVVFALTEDRSSVVRDRLTLLLKNGAQGLLLVFLTMWLFFQGRFAFWVAMGLPISFLGALFFMSVFGLTINMITMVALLIAIGLLMDDAIVIAENIATHLKRGKNAMQAAIDGTRQVAPGVRSSFLTTIAVFGPLAFLSGHLGKVLQFIPMVLILVIAVSLIEAFLILPHHLAHSLKHHEQETGRFRRAFDDHLLRFRDVTLGRIVDSVIHQRYWFVGGVIALFVASIGMMAGGKLKFQAFPDIEGDTIEARILLPQGTPLWRTEAVVERVTAGLKKVDETFTPLQPGGQRLLKNVQIRYNSNMDANEAGPHVATVTVDLLTAEERSGSLDDVINQWRSEVGDIPDLDALSFKEPVIGPGGIPMEIRLVGDDLDQLKQASRELQSWLSRYRGVFDVTDNLRPGKPELRLSLKEGALSLGLDAFTIANQLRAAFYGTTATEIQVGPESYEIDVRLMDQDRSDLTDVEMFRITTAAGDQVPLSAVAHIEHDRGYARIQRVNGRRTITVQGDIDSRIANAAEIVGDTKKHYLPQLLERYPGISAGIEGESKRTAKTAASMLRAFGIGLVGIFILLSFQFRSYVEPVVVMTVIPLALIGVVWGHLLMGLNLTMPGVIGFASLSGIVVNDSILLVEFLKLRVREGHAIVEAAKMASRERFRAVLLTSITTIAGLIPLLLEKSMQAQILIPLATSIVFGLLATTMLVLLVVPALFSILNDFGLLSEQDEEETQGTPGLPVK
ncbi:MAG: efflux RND transporter permease subunit [gamma proteobacterium endosymbiont of Lamellibrachia anaximandri]|nr:efflux RND transporter permease subunit [gamma proteobacterium endosymbiont of Lamellibrachia anaximandri]MBL3619318.1 efflux RND transporter permease subunit [gamma proteobacterium endosymbiont of Lamellibrachia anaximandri]